MTPAHLCSELGVCSTAATIPCANGCNAAQNDCASLGARGASCSTTSQCVTGLTCTDGVCCSSSSCPACQACNILGNLGTCTGKATGTADGACSGTCMTGACAAGGRCAPASASTSCGTGTCTNGSQGNGQWASPTFHPRNCNGSGTGDAACVLSTGNLGCSGNFVCLDGASCRTNCVREIDCVDGYYCASDGTCQQRMSTSSMSVCTKDQQCQSRVCMGSCVQCDMDDDCPRNTPLCSSNVCIPCYDYLPYYEQDGCNPPDYASMNSESAFCGTRTYPQQYYSCKCGTLNECPVGSVCNNNTCLIRGGQPCVANNCVYGSCTNGVCPLEPPNTPCTKTSVSRAASSGCTGACSKMCWDSLNYGDFSCCQ